MRYYSAIDQECEASLSNLQLEVRHTISHRRRISLRSPEAKILIGSDEGNSGSDKTEAMKENGGMQVYEILYVKVYYYEAAGNSVALPTLVNRLRVYAVSKNSADTVFEKFSGNFADQDILLFEFFWLYSTLNLIQLIGINEHMVVTKAIN